MNKTDMLKILVLAFSSLLIQGHIGKFLTIRDESQFEGLSMTYSGVVWRVSGCAEVSSERHTRAVWQFDSMIRAMTGRWALSYNNCGCWCGFGGGGRTLDAVDKCCKIHDKCYTRMFNQGCIPYFDSYDYTLHGSGITCNPEGADNSCESGISECDKAAAICFSRNTYNRANKWIDRKRKCLLHQRVL